jgi:septum formation protein
LIQDFFSKFWYWDEMRSSSRFSIVLASTSPRRVELMKQIRLNCQIEPPCVDEEIRPGEKAFDLVKRLAFEKAQSVCATAFRKYGECLIISADTVVVAPGSQVILGKPENLREAKRMLERLSGRTHSVLTGYCLLRFGKKGVQKKCSRVVVSKVKMRSLPDAMIRAYLATGESLDKAGSYGAQGAGAALIERIEGSYTNVVGLPLSEMVSDLQKFQVSLFK